MVDNRLEDESVIEENPVEPAPIILPETKIQRYPLQDQRIGSVDPLTKFDREQSLDAQSIQYRLVPPFLSDSRSIYNFFIVWVLSI